MQITTKQFRNKPEHIQELINEAIYILRKLGVPLEGLSSRRLERMAMAFLAIANVNNKKQWAELEDASNGRSLRTRDIIEYINAHFSENISSGSYDDIRRKDIILPVTLGIVVRTNPNAAMNDSRRGYAINPELGDIIRTFNLGNWQASKEFVKGRSDVIDALKAERKIERTSVKLSSGQNLVFTPGEHNLLQKAIIEEFLPRYGFKSKVLYVGDTANRFLILEEEELKKLDFFKLAHSELPDIIAYSEEKNWLYLIEAVHTCGPISPIRRLNLQALSNKCKADIIYVTAFLDRQTFRRFISHIAWETEVWIASEPDHLIHFDGEKFLGPYK